MQHDTIETFGEFPGVQHTTSRLHYWASVVDANGENAGVERQLFDAKWFDYRFMHPTLATYLYAHRYREVYKTIYGRHMDRRKAAHVRPLVGKKADKKPSLDLFDLGGPQIKGLWRGRMVADSMGIPYEVYIELAMTKAMRWQRGGYLPTPAQLYSDELIETVHAGWEERRKAQMWLATDRRYRTDLFAGTPAQVAHQHWICDLLMLRTPGTRRVLLGEYLRPGGYLTRAIAEERFGAEAIDEA